ILTADFGRTRIVQKETKRTKLAELSWQNYCHELLRGSSPATKVDSSTDGVKVIPTDSTFVPLCDVKRVLGLHIQAAIQKLALILVENANCMKFCQTATNCHSNPSNPFKVLPLSFCLVFALLARQAGAA